MNLVLKYLFIGTIILFAGCVCENDSISTTKNNSVLLPDTSKIPHTKLGDEIRYGYQLFTRTAYYLGPEGKVLQLTGNKMNCKNCHLDAGIRPMSNSLSETYLKYPQYRGRDGKVLTVEDRINNCFERPMNGKMLPYESREMRAMVSYMRWLCEGRKASFGDDSLHLGTIKLIDRAASVENGAKIYNKFCVKCHGADGQGVLTPNKETYIYPPLWGMNSYAQGSSMHRIVTASRFVKWSMPFAEKKTVPQLTDEEVFDVVAFMNCDSIHPRPYRDLKKDCPDIEFKPIDFPAGPYIDPYPESQHRLGPFKPIIEFYEKRNKTKSLKN